MLDIVNYSYMICSGTVKAECHNADNSKTNHAQDEVENALTKIGMELRDDPEYF